MTSGSAPPPPNPLPINPVPRSLLDQFLQELADLGVPERQVEGHLVFLRLWQKFIAPHRLLQAEPEALARFVTFLKGQDLRGAELRLANEAVEHFYAFALDRQAEWEARDAWQRRAASPPARRRVPLWEALMRRFGPALKRTDDGLLTWPRP